MSETAKLGLIRCPKCQKLLSELNDNSAYLCSNCDAILRAKRATLEEEMLRIGGVSERSSEISREINGEEGMTNNVTHYYKNTNFNNIGYENYGTNGISVAQVFVDSMFPKGNNGVGLQRIRDRPSTSTYYDSNPMEKRYQKDEFDGFGYRVDERAELLHKLDELRDQIARTYSVQSKSKDMVLIDNRMVSHYSFPYMNDHHHAKNELYNSCSLCYRDRDRSSSSKQLRRGLNQPFYAPPIEHKPEYTDRNRVHNDLFESYPSIMYRDRFHHHDHKAYDEATFDHRSVHELQESHYSESHSDPTSRVLTTNNGRICPPIVSGAPFLTCLNCLEVLFLPKKVFIRNENEKKVKCGVCSMTIMITVETNRLVFSILEEKDQICENDDVDDVDDGSNKLLSEKSSCAALAKTSFFGEDSDNSCSRSTNHSTYSSTSNKVEDLKTFPSLEKEPTIPPPRGSSLQEYFDYSDKFKVMKHIEKGEGSGQQQHKLDNSSITSGISMQNSIKNDTSETVIDVPSSEFSNTGNSLVSDEASKVEGDINKVVPQLLENCFEDKVDVTINGYIIPYSLIKRAEKLAGPIYPGHFWYDFRAGFWGVMDGPCLGIIPPFIEEFNCPMPKSCTGGKTGIFVNGRELHEKDLTVLSRRGLPTERDRSYIVEISGRILDEVTGEELERLGRLAPTVEKSNHGFGMRDPKATA